MRPQAHGRDDDGRTDGQLTSNAATNGGA